MRSFIIGFAVVQLGLVGADVLLRVAQHLPAFDRIGHLLLVLCVFPTLAAAGAAAAVHRWRPLRTFDLAGVHPRGPFVLGVLSGVLGVALAVFPISVIWTAKADAAILSASAAAGPASALPAATTCAARWAKGVVRSAGAGS